MMCGAKCFCGCGKAMIREYQEHINGTICESLDSCPYGFYVQEYAYGHTHCMFSDGFEIGFSHTTPLLEAERRILKLKTHSQTWQFKLYKLQKRIKLWFK